jgi:hypothetical protein
MVIVSPKQLSSKLKHQIAVFEQHLAVFGESGSGKTVMLSSFYGATQEPQYLKKTLFHVVADDTGQGNRLHQKYLGMKNSAQLPEPNRFAATSYSFKIQLKDGPGSKAMTAPFSSLRLVWHDYPGEWFEQGVSGPEEARRRVNTFRSLLGSDVALLLVDGQRLVDNPGDEGRYLRSLLTNFRNGLLRLKEDLLKDGKPLVVFPRIWIMALSKSDLLPDVNVFKFKELLIEKACDDIDELRNALAGFVEPRDALSVGEDFMLLSSAKFEPNKIEVTKRIGLDLILPLAATLPFERYVGWAQAKQVSWKVAETLLGGGGALAALAAALIGGKGKLRGQIGFIGVLATVLNPKLVNDATKLGRERVREINDQARAKKDYLTATLTGFRMDLDKGEDEGILLLSRK